MKLAKKAAKEVLSSGGNAEQAAAAAQAFGTPCDDDDNSDDSDDSDAEPLDAVDEANGEEDAEQVLSAAVEEQCSVGAGTSSGPTASTSGDGRSGSGVNSHGGGDVAIPELT